MAKRKNQIKTGPNKSKRFNSQSIVLIIVGAIFLTSGLIRYLLTPPAPGINLSKLQPVIIDGSISIILGAGFLITGIFRLVFRHKVLNDQIQLEKEIEEEKSRKARQIYGYKK